MPACWLDDRAAGVDAGRASPGAKPHHAILQPAALVTALIAAVVLDEQLARYHLVGGLLTLAGVVLAERWTTPIRR